MKKITLSLVLSLLLALSLRAQNDDIRVETAVEKATVFLSGAEVSRFSAVSLKPGRTNLIFTGLSSRIDPNSIHASTTNGARIMAITYEVNYLNTQKATDRIKQVQDSLELLNTRFTELRSQDDAYKEEKALLQKNSSIGGTQYGVSMTELQRAADYYRSRIMEINKLRDGVNRESNELKEIQVRLNAQLAEFNAKRNVPTHEISITLQSDAATQTRVDVQYLVLGAGWSPKYDIRAESVEDPIQLEFHALVVNKSDIDWKDVDLTLSTADPTKSAESPRLTTWALNYTGEVTSNVGRLNYYEVDKGYGPANARGGEDVGLDGIELTEIEVSELSVDYEITEDYTIPSDGKPYMVDIKDVTLPADYQYMAVPKMDKDAFLLARIVDWERLNLVEGPANIYFSGTYIGKSFIYTRYSNDTLALSLGRDKKVLVSRTKREEFSSKKFLGTNIKEEFSFRINIKNTNSTPIRIRVDDQLPVSQNSEIEVRMVDIGSAVYDETTGLLSWDVTLKPSEHRTLDFSYWVKYPKNKPVMLRQQRKMYAPKLY